MSLPIGSFHVNSTNASRVTIFNLAVFFIKCSPASVVENLKILASYSYWLRSYDHFYTGGVDRFSGVREVALQKVTSLDTYNFIKKTSTSTKTFPQTKLWPIYSKMTSEFTQILYFQRYRLTNMLRNLRIFSLSHVWKHFSSKPNAPTLV